MPSTPEQLQRDFYTANAARYDEMHVADDDPHAAALGLVSALIDGYGFESLLDVGAGTGRGLRHFTDAHPGLDAAGIEPVRAMIEQAERRHGIEPGRIIEGSGARMPFGDERFDVVCEFGVLHHVADPAEIVAEMTRVARRAIFLSDTNRFGGGGPLHRAGKYLLYRLGLWPTVYRLATRGRGYHLDAGDGGVVYSYSVYDSLPMLNQWADRVFLVPTAPARSGWFHPLFGVQTVLLCALRDG